MIIQTSPSRAFLETLVFWLKKIPSVVSQVVITLVVFAPMYWILISAFKGPEEIIRSSPTFWPESWTFGNFERLLTSTDYQVFLGNSLTVSVITASISVVVSVAAAYGLYRLKVPGGGRIAGVILLAYMIPGTLLIVPLHQTLSSIGLIDSHSALVLLNVAFTAPFSTWLLRGFILSIPSELDDAASIDGAGPVRTMFEVVLPLLTPGMATVAVYSFVFSWTEFVFASQFVSRQELQTLPIGLSSIIGQYTVDWGLVLAGVILTMLPALIIFLLIGRFFVGGLIAGATK